MREKERDLPSLLELYNQLASQIIDMAISYAKEKRCYKVILQSGIARTEAHQLYENKGFNGNSKRAFDMRLE